MPNYPLPQFRVLFKLAVTVHWFLNGRTPPSVPAGLLCRSRRWWYLVAFALGQLSTACSTTLPAQYLGHRAFTAAGTLVWNSLHDFIRDQTISAHSFGYLLKIHLLSILVHLRFLTITTLHKVLSENRLCKPNQYKHPNCHFYLKRRLTLNYAEFVKNAWILPNF